MDNLKKYANQFYDWLLIRTNPGKQLIVVLLCVFFFLFLPIVLGIVNLEKIKACETFLCLYEGTAFWALIFCFCFTLSMIWAVGVWLPANVKILFPGSSGNSGDMEG